jgi:hypothetical protein
MTKKNSTSTATLIWRILGAVLAVLGIIFGNSIYSECIRHFEVSIKPLEIVISQGGRGETTVSINNASILSLDYKEPVNLEAQGPQQDIKFTFSPDSPTLPNFDCKVLIEVGSTVAPDKYKFTVIGTGGNGLTHSADFFINVKIPPCPSPFIIDVDQYFVPSGFMCNTSDIQLNTRCNVAPFSGTTCTKIVYSARTNNQCQNDGWIGAGIYWFCVGCNWGQTKPDPVKYNFSCAKSLIFMAKGESGGEIAEFKVGGVTGKYNDSVNPALSTGVITLTNEWKEYRIDFNSGDNLTSMISGFCWVTNRDWNPNGCIIYLDDIKFVDR